MSEKALSYWDVDGGRLAQYYAAKPYGHYKEEIYPLFAEILDGLGDGVRVLDIGAGPGHMAYEFYKTRPRSSVRFGLLEVGETMLDIAAKRLSEAGHKPDLYRRSFNSPNWHEDLGKFDAIISNNAIFNMKPELLPEFYKAAYGLLHGAGVLMNQQAFGYETPKFKDALKNFPPALSPLKLLTAEQLTQVAEIKQAEAQQRKVNEVRIAEMKKAGQKFVDADAVGYASLHIPASAHVQYLNDAGFTADCIWRKMEFAIVVGLKGQPFRSDV